MTAKMLIESDPHQTRIAILEDDRLTEIFVERHRHRGLVGNVYKGRVTRVLPGMQAAFVDVGLERDAFLYVSDVAGDVEAMEELEIEEPRSDEPPASHPPAPSIDELLKPGQEIIVQVVKDPLPNKGARISTHVTLPGRYLVLLPTVRHFGVSRRIEDETERELLLALISQLAGGSSGLIVRTVGEGKGPEEFESDFAYLSRLWERTRHRAGRVAAPTLLHQDLDLALRVVRDMLRPDFSVLWVDGEETYERIVEFLDQVQPSLVGKVKLFRQGATLFEQFGIEEQIEAALKSKVWLKSGGYIVINQTEALVAIDVNTGRFVGQSNLEDTVLQTNLEAVQEIVRQIRLRDLGGIIVIDLIDMVEPAHREEVFGALEGELRKDRAKTKMLNISEFGLVEITRKRSRANLERLLTQPCPYCSGRGRMKSIATICLNLRKELLHLRGRFGQQPELLLRVHPEVARALQTEERAILDELERSLGVRILLQSDPELHHERFDVVEV
ncbi:MAG TPA: Rne/Rng family ribonuclease [Acidobacteria bacterium]|nr:Rne/Rng family ribonuclease [Acidobacteriota bacterium]